MFGELWNIINTKVGVAVISCVATALCGVFVHRWRTRRDQKVKFENVIGEKIAIALDAIRDIELSTKTIEIYDIDNILKEKGKDIDFFGGEAVYPAIMTSKEHFMNFSEAISTARSDFERYLDYTVAAYLYYIERYCMQLMVYAGQYNLEYDLLGTIVIFDIKKWQLMLEKELVKRINRPRYKVYAKTGVLWEMKKKKIMDKLWENSLLNKLLKEDKSPEIRAVEAVLFKRPEAEELVQNM